MQNQFNFQRLDQGKFESVDQGTWQPPLQTSQQQQQQQHQQPQQTPEDTYFTGICTQVNATYYTNQQSGSVPCQTLGANVATANFKSVGNNKFPSNSRISQLGQQSQYSQQSGNNRQLVSSQLNLMDRSVGNVNQSTIDDAEGGYYGFPNESYMTNSGVSMGMNSTNLSGAASGSNSMNSGSGMGNSSTALLSGSGNFNSNLTGSFNSDNNMMMNSGSNSMMINSNNMMVNRSNSNLMTNNNNLGMDSGSIATQFQNHLMAAVGMGGFSGDWQNPPFGNNGGFNNSGGNFSKRGKRGRGFNSRFKGADMFYQDRDPITGGHQHGQQCTGGHNLAIHLTATNHNHWCFLRKNFNKRDNDLVEHLFDIHEKFCHQCKERVEEKKYGKKKKYFEDCLASEPATEEESQEELTEEELEIKKLMGFAGFKSTKGSRMKDNNYSAVSSVNIDGSNEPVDQTTTLTEEEKRMMVAIGGFSVFTRNDTSSTKPGFGAPAVTFDPAEGSGPGYSNEPLFDNKTGSDNTKVTEKKREENS